MGVPEDRQPEQQSGDLVRYAAEQATEELSVFMGTLAGSASMQLGELVGDRVKFWRFKQNLKHAQKAKQMLDDAGLEPTQVPFRTLVPLVESASLEDDEGMTDRWAALLANAAGKTTDVPPSFPNVLRELEPTQAALLLEIWQTNMRLAPDLRRGYGVSRRGYELSEEQWDYHMDNLARLRLVQGTGIGSKQLETVMLTAFGRAFIRACRPPSAPDPPITHTSKAAVDKIVAENKARWTDRERQEQAPDDAPHDG